jgi:hypothetical protein
MYTGFWQGNLREKTTWKTRHRWQHNIKMNLQEVGCRAWIGLLWLRNETGVGLL